MLATLRSLSSSEGWAGLAPATGTATSPGRLVSLSTGLQASAAATALSATLARSLYRGNRVLARLPAKDTCQCMSVSLSVSCLPR